MEYLRAEHLKYKRTMSNKLVIIAPCFTLMFAFLMGGFRGVQSMSFYWWYAFLLPGTIAILAVMSQRKEQCAGNYYSLFSAPINLKKFQLGKSFIMIEKLMIAAIILSVLVSGIMVMAPSMVVYEFITCLQGSIVVILATVWQVPLCLLLTRRTGTLMTIILNSLLGIFTPIIFANSTLWFLCPYTYPAKISEYTLGIAINGTYTGEIIFSSNIILILGLSTLLFGILMLLDVSLFSRVEGE